MDFDKMLEEQRMKYDLQEANIFHYCNKCNCEIYEGNRYYINDYGEILCEYCFDCELDEIKRESERIAGEED